MSDEFTVDGIFQARVSSKRESKAGIFLTVEIAADDYSPALAQLRAGSLLKMGWQELVDVSVRPIEIETPTPAMHAAAKMHEEMRKPKRTFKDLSLPEQAGIRCEDAAFKEFLADRSGLDEPDPAQYVRFICGVTSRSELSTNREAANKWRKLNAEFEAWQLDQKYADTRR